MTIYIAHRVAMARNVELRKNLSTEIDLLFQYK